jgi:hypothetical protein
MPNVGTPFSGAEKIGGSTREFCRCEPLATGLSEYAGADMTFEKRKKQCQPADYARNNRGIQILLAKVLLGVLSAVRY